MVFPSTNLIWLPPLLSTWPVRNRGQSWVPRMAPSPGLSSQCHGRTFVLTWTDTNSGYGFASRLSAFLLAFHSQTCRMLNPSSNILYLEMYKYFSSRIFKRNIFCLYFLTNISTRQNSLNTWSLYLIIFKVLPNEDASKSKTF